MKYDISEIPNIFVGFLNNSTAMSTFFFTKDELELLNALKSYKTTVENQSDRCSA